MCSKPLFIFGSPRSGTTYLLELLNHHSKVLLTNELRMMSFYAQTFATASQARHQIHNADLRGPFIEHMKAQLRPAIESYYRQLAAERLKSPTVFGDKNPGYADPVLSPGCLEFILETFPDARFIHIRRDPRAVVRSLVGKRWMGLDAAVALWARITSRGRALRREVAPHQYLEVTHEALTNHPSTVVPSILRFLELEPEQILSDFIASETLQRTPYSDPIALPGNRATFQLTELQESRLLELLGPSAEVDEMLEHYDAAQSSSHPVIEVEGGSPIGEMAQVPAESLLGELEVRILAYSLVVNDSQVVSGSPVHPGDRVSIAVRVASLRHFPQTVFGVSISDESGRVVASGNNASASLQTFGLTPGVSTLSLTFIWPDCGRGLFRLTPGVGEGADGDHNLVQCWADSCCALRQAPSRESSALITLRILSAERC